VFACEDKFRHLLLRFDRISQLHYGERFNPGAGAWGDISKREKNNAKEFTSNLAFFTLFIK
jgi:hypothetical protein